MSGQNQNAEFDLKVTIKNGLIARKIKRMYGTTAEMCRRYPEMSANEVSAYITMRKSPYNKVSGDLTNCAAILCDALNSMPERLWPEAIANRTGMKNTSTVQLTAEEVDQISQHVSSPQLLVEQREAIDIMMDCLSERQREIVLARNAGMTFEEVAQEQGVTRERIRQIEWKAHQKMRQKAVKMKLVGDNYDASELLGGAQ